jgi:hypothetical protein
MNAEFSKFFNSVRDSFPPYYSVVLRALEQKKGIRIVVVFRTGSRRDSHADAYSIHRPGDVLIFLPSAMRNSSDKSSEMDRRSEELATCLALGQELGYIFLGLKGGGSKSLPAELELLAEEFSVQIALRSGLLAFDSQTLISLLKHWDESKAKRLASLFRNELFDQQIIPFVTPLAHLSSHALYATTRHASRASTLLAGLYSDSEIFHDIFLPEFLKTDYVETVFSLDSVRVSSPGTFVLGLKKRWKQFADTLKFVRKALKEVPYLDLRVERHEAQLVRDIEVSAADTEKAKRDQTKYRIERKYLEHLERRMELEPDRLIKLEEVAPGAVTKLLESSSFLEKNGIKPSD